MLGAVLTDVGNLQLLDQQPTSPRPGQVLVRVGTVGLCTTDLHLVDGLFPARMPVVLGHEFSGVVEAVGPGVEDISPGTHVTVDPALPCGRCRACQQGYIELCANFNSHGSTMNGGLAEYVVVDRRQLFPTSLPSDISCWAEPLTCVLHGARTALPDSAGRSALVVGLGASGLLFVQVLRALGATHVVGLDRNEDKQERALGLGVMEAHGKLEAAGAGDERGYDLVVDTTASMPLISRAVKFLAPKGTLLLYSVPAPHSILDLRAFDLYRRELRVLGTFAGPYQFRLAIAFLEQGVVQVSPLVTQRFALADVIEAFSVLRQGGQGVVKVQVQVA